MTRLEAWLLDAWYHRRRPPLILVPLSWLFGIAAAARRWSFRSGLRRTRHPGVPVVVVGNVTVGGTGKTPLVIWLARRLAQRGYHPGVASRGYAAAEQPREPCQVSPDSDPARVGDEPVLIARRAGCPTVVCRDRVAAAERLRELGADVVIADDGLQHYRLQRDVEIAVVDGHRGLGNGRLLPAGPLREPADRLARVDAVVVNGPSAGAAPAPGAVAMRLQPADARRVDGKGAAPLASFAGRPVHAVAGIGNPERFFQLLEKLGLRVDRRPLADHAAVDADDVAFADDAPVLMTEKDAVKCGAFAEAHHWYVPVDAAIDDPGGTGLVDRVIAGMTKP